MLHRQTLQRVPVGTEESVAIADKSIFNIRLLHRVPDASACAQRLKLTRIGDWKRTVLPAKIVFDALMPVAGGEYHP